jgi:predicted transcriptional regulator
LFVKSENAARISLLPSAEVEILRHIWEHHYELRERKVVGFD